MEAIDSSQHVHCEFQSHLGSLYKSLKMGEAGQAAVFAEQSEHSSKAAVPDDLSLISIMEIV